MHQEETILHHRSLDIFYIFERWYTNIKYKKSMTKVCIGGERREVECPSTFFAAQTPPVLSYARIWKFKLLIPENYIEHRIDEILVSRSNLEIEAF